MDYVADRIAEGVGVDDQVEGGMRGDGGVCGDLSSLLSFPDKKFDHVVMLAVLKHLTELEVVPREAYRLLVEGTASWEQHSNIELRTPVLGSAQIFGV